MDDSGDRTIRFGNGTTVSLPFRARTVRRAANIVLVLLDPDHYLRDESYKASRTQGALALRNLIAFDPMGIQLWEAELPESVDYYYLIEDGLPLRALSYSGNRCEIDERDGRIVRREFLK